MNVHIFFHNFSSEGTILDDVVNALKEQHGKSVRSFDNCSNEQIATGIKEINYGIICQFIQDEATLKVALAFLKKFKEQIVKEQIKVVCFNEITEGRVKEALMRGGAVDVFDGQVTDKAFKHKIEFLSKFLEKKWGHIIKVKKTEAVAAIKPAEKLKDKKIEPIREAPKSQDKGQVISLDPINTFKDFWLSNFKEESYYSMKKWVVFLTGPGAWVVKWEQIQDNMDRPFGNKLWKFVPVLKDNPEMNNYFFSSNDDESWYFIGLKPKFDVNRLEWVFSGQDISLFFKQGDTTFEKFISKENSLYLASNSKVGEGHKEKINSTFGQDFENMQKGGGAVKTYRGQFSSDKGASKTLDEITSKEQEEERKKQAEEAEKERLRANAEKEKKKEDARLAKEKIEKEKKVGVTNVLDKHDKTDKDQNAALRKLFLVEEKKPLTEEEKKKKEEIDKIIDNFVEEIQLPSAELKTYLFTGIDYHEGFECVVSDIFEGEINLVAKKKTPYKINDVVNVYMIFVSDGEQNDLGYKGQIKEMDQVEGDSGFEHYLSLKLYDFDQELYDDFLKDYKKVQSKIVEYMSKIKGAA